LTLEHLISKPISTALVIDRSSNIGEFQLTTGGPVAEGIRFVTLGNLKVRSACRECNNGWMAALEESAAEGFRSWIKHGRLPPGDEDAIRRWLGVRLIIWTLRDGGIRSLEERVEQGEPCAIPHFDRARRLASCTSDALDGLAAGVAKATGNPMYAFGNASTGPEGKGRPFTAVLALHLPPVQLWVADAVLECEIRLPTGVRALKPGLALRRLRPRGSNLSPDQALVRFSSTIDDIDWNAIAT